MSKAKHLGFYKKKSGMSKFSKFIWAWIFGGLALSAFIAMSFLVVMAGLFIAELIQIEPAYRLPLILLFIKTPIVGYAIMKWIGYD